MFRSKKVKARPRRPVIFKHKVVFRRQGPFRYFDLPIEIRYQILELLLVRDNVALAADSGIRKRFPRWRHERPQWALVSAVNRQMQDEAMQILYSAKNTFFAPIDDVKFDHQGRFRDAHPDGIFPPLNKLDIAFDMGDTMTNSFTSVGITKEWWDLNNPWTPFEELSSNQRREVIHEDQQIDLRDNFWDRNGSACVALGGLRLLRIDLTNGRCPAGCCRMGLDAMETFDEYLPSSGDDAIPKRIEIVGAISSEQEALRARLAESSGIPSTRIVFVDNPGCTCTSTSTCDESSRPVLSPR